MASLYNLARMTISSGGTGTLTLAGASPGYLTFDAAGVQNGDVVSYGIRDGANSETGTGTYTTATKTLTRTVTVSTNSNNAIDASLSAEVYITARSEDILTPTEAAAAYQPLDSDLTSIAALSTTTYGRSLLTLADDDALANEIRDLNIIWTGDNSFLSSIEVQGLAILDYNALTIRDSDASHLLTVQFTSDLSANRALTVVNGDADRTLTLAGNATISQDYSTTGNPQFATIELGAATDTTLSRASAGVLAVEGVNVLTTATGQPLDATLTSIAALGTAADRVAYTTGVDTWAETPLTSFGRSIIDDADEATFKATVNLEIGTDVQAYDAGLADIAGLAVTDGNIIVGNGANWVAESGNTARTSLGLGTGDSPTFTAVTVGNTGLTVGASSPFSDAAGTLTLQNVDALDATTEATVEAAIDTLANLTSVQGLTVTLADAGADAVLGWDDSAGAYENLTAAEVRAIIGDPLAVANGGTGQTTEAEAIGEMVQALTADATPDWGADYIPSYDASADTGKKLLLSTVCREKLTGNRSYYVRTSLGTCTISNASPAVCTNTAHGLSANDPVVFSTDGTLPTGVTAGTVYYVISTGLATDTFQFSATEGGAAVNTSSAGSGTHTVATGNDNNNGLAATRAGAFLTLQEAYDVIASTLDVAGYTVSVFVADSTYSAGFKCSTSWVGGGVVRFEGDTTTPSNVLISTASTNCFWVDVNLLGTLQLYGFKTVTAGVNSHIYVLAPCRILYGSWDFGSSNSGNYYHIYIEASAIVLATTNYAITGGMYNHAAAVFPGASWQTSPITVTITDSTAWSSAFVQSSSGAYVYSAGATFSGASLTGARYAVSNNAIIQTSGGGASYFPGNSAGSATTGGIYA
jgi:hypothetical protein